MCISLARACSLSSLVSPPQRPSRGRIAVRLFSARPHDALRRAESIFSSRYRPRAVRGARSAVRRCCVGAALAGSGALAAETESRMFGSHRWRAPRRERPRSSPPAPRRDPRVAFYGGLVELKYICKHKAARIRGERSWRRSCAARGAPEREGRGARGGYRLGYFGRRSRLTSASVPRTSLGSFCEYMGHECLKTDFLSQFGTRGGIVIQPNFTAALSR